VHGGALEDATAVAAFGAFGPLPLPAIMRRSQGKEIAVRGVRSTFDSRPSRTNALWHLIGQDHRIEERYHIPAANFLGHADVAPRRKTDPSGYFPWKKLADQGFGLWCDPPYPEPPAAFDTALALRALGYDTGDATAAVRAFKLHFQPTWRLAALRGKRVLPAEGFYSRFYEYLHLYGCGCRSSGSGSGPCSGLRVGVLCNGRHRGVQVI
jgi:hypothetical protein